MYSTVAVPCQLPVKSQSKPQKVKSCLLQAFGQITLPGERMQQRSESRQELSGMASTGARVPDAGVKRGRKTGMWFQARHASFP